MVEILKLMPGRDSEEEIWSRFVFELVLWPIRLFGKMNSTLGSVVPLAMFPHRFETHATCLKLFLAVLWLPKLLPKKCTFSWITALSSQKKTAQPEALSQISHSGFCTSIVPKWQFNDQITIVNGQSPGMELTRNELMFSNGAKWDGGLINQLPIDHLKSPAKH